MSLESDIKKIKEELKVFKEDYLQTIKAVKDLQDFKTRYFYVVNELAQELEVLRRAGSNDNHKQGSNT